MNFGARSSSSLPRHVIRSTIARAAAPAATPWRTRARTRRSARIERGCRPATATRATSPATSGAGPTAETCIACSDFLQRRRVPERRADGVFRGQDRDRDEAVAGTRAHRNDPNARSRRAARKPWARARARARTRRAAARRADVNALSLSSRLCGARPMFFRGVSSLKKKKTGETTASRSGTTASTPWTATWSWPRAISTRRCTTCRSPARGGSRRTRARTRKTRAWTCAPEFTGIRDCQTRCARDKRDKKHACGEACQTAFGSACDRAFPASGEGGSTNFKICLSYMSASCEDTCGKFRS